jgi:hypothetical protein
MTKKGLSSALPAEIVRVWVCENWIFLRNSTLTKHDGVYVPALDPIVRTYHLLSVLAITSASYCGDLRFESLPWDRLHWPFFIVFTSVPPGNCWGTFQATTAWLHALSNLYIIIIINGKTAFLFHKRSLEDFARFVYGPSGFHFFVFRTNFSQIKVISPASNPETGGPSFLI